MLDEKCTHHWEMINIQSGFIITEKCFHCNKISTYFSFEQNPPLEEYREGDHFWNAVESAQSICFDLFCGKCNSLVNFNEFAGLMMCTGCVDKCDVNKLMKKLEQERTWVYVVLGFLPLVEKKQPGKEKISILEEYFNQRRKSSKSRIKFVSYELIENLSTCYAEMIKDVGMLSLTSTKKN